MKVIYPVPRHIASFGGVNVLHRAAKGKVAKKTVHKYLCSVDSYTLLKPVPRNFPKNEAIVCPMDQQ